MSYIQDTAFNQPPMLCLLDSGATGCWISRKQLPSTIRTNKIPAITNQTLAGNFTSNESIILKHVLLPEFHRTRRLDTLQAKIFDQSCRYDMILGRDLMNDLGIVLNFESKSMEWDKAIVAMREHPTNASNTSVATNLLLEAIDGGLDDNDSTLVLDQTSDLHYQANNANPEGYKARTIATSLYEPADLQEIVNKCTYLLPPQRQQLHQMLQKFHKLFDGQLKTFKGPPVHLQLIENPKPVRRRPYSVPTSHLTVFKAELQRLLVIGVIEKAARLEWIAGTFIVPKKDGRVRWITDFRGLNKSLRRKVYPLRKISEIFQHRSGYKFFTKLDISMQYYTFLLDESSRNLCTFATPFGLYRYCRLPMGVSESPDIATENMHLVLDGIEDIEFYMDDIGVFSDSWDAHLSLLSLVLTRLQDVGFTINPLKCEWAVQETDFLGHWLTPEGVKAWRKKIEAILHLQPPVNVKQLRSFLGMVNYYRDMWPRRTHVLAPLTELTGKRTFVWTPKHQQAYERMKALVAADALLVFPDHSLPFDVETDASEYQLGSVIKQKGRPVAYYSRKLNSAQRNYTTIEKELLSIVETFKEFRTVLLGASIRVHTDHKNLTHRLTDFTTQRVLRWRLLLEEFNPTFLYKSGPSNVLADALSRVPTARTERESSRSDLTSNEELMFCLSSYPILVEFPMDQEVTPSANCHNNYVAGQEAAGLNRPGRCPFTTNVAQHQQEELFLEHPMFDEQGRLPFHYKTLFDYQQEDPQLLELPTSTPQQYRWENMGGHLLVCRHHNQHNRVCLTDKMLPLIVDWFHKATAHNLGITRLQENLRFHFYHPRLLAEFRKQVSACDLCQRMKRGWRQYGLLASRDARSSPWSEVAMDCIGPWNIELRGGRDYNIRALTTIDVTTNLLEIEPILTQTSAECARAFENGWLSRYPRPMRVIHDQGSEFMGAPFQDLLRRAGIKSVPTTARNPQGNSIVEAVHKSVGQVLRTLVHVHNPQTVHQAKAVCDTALATSMHATRCASHQALQHLTPGSFAFRWDMFFDLPLLTDIMALQNTRQQLVDARLFKENSSRINHDYKTGDQILKKSVLSLSDKLKPTFTGPYPILQVHTNGTVTIRLRDNLTERINIRRIKPYHT